VQPSREVSVMAALVYQKTTFDTPLSDSPDKWMSLGARPMYQWSEHLGSAVEVALDRVKYNNGETGNLRKVTIVPVVVRAGRGAFSRPELRLFATFAKWNSEANTAATTAAARILSPQTNLVNGGDFTTSTLTSGRTIGVQAEAWW
jgi:maltoporin